MQHPMARNHMGSYNNQMGFSISSIWDDFRENNIDPMVDQTLTSAGFTQAEADKIRADAAASLTKTAQQTLQDEMNKAMGVKTPTQNAVSNLQAQLAYYQNRLANSVPGGMVTIYAVGGLLGGFALYKILAGPKDAN